MATRSYESGTIKVVWLEKDADKIYSKMFDTPAEAEKFGKTKKNYVIFSLIDQQNMEEFSWKLLPYGNHQLYIKLIGGYLKHKATALKILEKFF